MKTVYLKIEIPGEKETNKQTKSNLDTWVIFSWAILLNFYIWGK